VGQILETGALRACSKSNQFGGKPQMFITKEPSQMAHEFIPSGFELLAGFAGAAILSMFAASYFSIRF